MWIEDALAADIKPEAVIRARDRVIDQRASLEGRKAMWAPPANSHDCILLIAEQDHWLAQ
jgi:hypothetical protein